MSLPSGPLAWKMGLMRKTAMLGLLLLLVACQTNPITGRSQFQIFSESEMNALGVQAYAEATDPATVNISKDPAFTAPLLRVGQAISTAADKPDYEWEFTLINDPQTVNAWAMPGGKISFYTGIYPILQDEASMAVVMGHEVMHAILGHGNERMSQTTVAQLGLSVADLTLKDSAYRGEILQALGLGVNVGVLLPYSRAHESEADEYGLYLAARAGYDPRAAIGLWERMAALSGDRPPEFLSTHPDPQARIEAMKKLMPRALELYEAAPVKHPNRPLPMPRGTVRCQDIFFHVAPGGGARPNRSPSPAYDGAGGPA